MINICTHSDINYLYKGLALYHSLEETIKEDFTLFYLCNDDETFNALKKLNKPNIKIFKLSFLESIESLLLRAKRQKKCMYARSQHEQYMWCLTPYFVNYILHYFIEDNDTLVYADADIYFYESVQLILDTVKDKSIGVHTHKFSGEFKDDIATGWYNVGVVTFKRDVIGLKASNYWKDLVLYPDNEHYEKYGTCGDQKYLELIVEKHKDVVCIFDETSNIGHLAAWCSSPLALNPDNKKIIYKGNVQYLVFYHFSHFNCEISTNSWRDHNNIDKPEWHPSSHPFIKDLYENYFKVIKKINL